MKRFFFRKTILLVENYFSRGASGHLKFLLRVRDFHRDRINAVKVMKLLQDD